MISRIPSWADLSQAGRAEEIASLRRRAQAILLGCRVHWQRSVFRVRAMVKDEHQLRFDELIRILDGAETTADEFLAAIDALYREYEELRGWISWWLLPANASMVFRAIQLMSPELQQRISSSTNAAESSHNQLYAAAGKNHDLVEGCRRLFIVQSQVEAHYKAIIGVYTSSFKFRILYFFLHSGERPGKISGTRAPSSFADQTILPERWSARHTAAPGGSSGHRGAHDVSKDRSGP